MRRGLFFVLLVFMAVPALAAKRETAAQLEQALIAGSSAHKTDAEMARQIGSTELSEQLSEATLDRLRAQVILGPQATVSLQLLADQSAFLDPPASELPTMAAPEAAAQQRMLAAARSYVGETLPRLPNFLATRTINRYDDSPQAVKKDGWPVRAGLHRVDTSSREISVRDERENQPPTQGSAVWERQIGLISGGEFGTTLGMILTDTFQGRVTWSHWEQIAHAPAAVFRYEVPRTASHFELISTLQREAAVEGFAAPSGPRGIASIGVRPNNDPARTSIVRVRPAYHGSLWIDPATGTILRITMEAELKDSDPFRRAAILVEYGPVKIGDATFICPVRSLALSLAAFDTQGSASDAPTEWLNETLFTAYHRFASTTRVLGDSAP
ncbi:MAG TPA: hypothetical protein VMR02_17005 [Terracidiphilus sp.]|jgi:hypothetical protein|nr:hypothetical protein [Terracidiphilus sp.]